MALAVPPGMMAGAHPATAVLPEIVAGACPVTAAAAEGKGADEFGRPLEPLDWFVVYTGHKTARIGDSGRHG